MKTNLLTLLIFAIASVLYSCTKESDNNYASQNASDKNALTTAERKIIISNCSGHSGCHSGARLTQVVNMQETDFILKRNISTPDYGLCNRNKLQSWVKGEDQK